MMSDWLQKQHPQPFAFDNNNKNLAGGLVMAETCQLGAFTNDNFTGKFENVFGWGGAWG